MPGYHHVEHVMGMAISIDVHDEVTGAPGLDSVVTWLHHVDRTFSTYRDDSTISRLGRGEIDVRDVTDEARDVLLRCEDLRRVTAGAFDAFVVPAPNGTMLDPSGYVKGWAIERAALLLESCGLRHFAINAGGDVALRGKPIPDPTWQVGIRDPGDPSRVCAVLPLNGPCGIATSGSYERGAHIIDPRTGGPTADVASVTVVGPDLGVADAYATAVFVMGVGGLAWLALRPGYDGLVISHDGQLHASPRFRAHLGRVTSPRLQASEHG